jgi:superfamily II DNA helicase RecQ
MRIKILTLRYSQRSSEFDSDVLEQFQNDHQLISFEPKYFELHGIPHFSLVMSYESLIGSDREVPDKLHNQRVQEKKLPADEGLGDEDRRIFESMRQWRTAKSIAEGVPPYVILTNKQLREIIDKKPRNKTALSKITSLGTARIKRHGEELLAQLHSSSKVEESSLDSQPKTQEESK